VQLRGFQNRYHCPGLPMKHGSQEVANIQLKKSKNTSLLFPTTVIWPHTEFSLLITLETDDTNGMTLFAFLRKKPYWILN
ncbi:MAG: hypothetical protein PHG06_21920, partial [Parabacteroides sp.]|nr:hypothetical protein [Parabacteroides sp.]